MGSPRARRRGPPDTVEGPVCQTGVSAGAGPRAPRFPPRLPSPLSRPGPSRHPTRPRPGGAPPAAAATLKTSGLTAAPTTARDGDPWAKRRAQDGLTGPGAPGTQRKSSNLFRSRSASTSKLWNCLTSRVVSLDLGAAEASASPSASTPSGRTGGAGTPGLRAPVGEGRCVGLRERGREQDRYLPDLLRLRLTRHRKRLRVSTHLHSRKVTKGKASTTDGAPPAALH